MEKLFLPCIPDQTFGHLGYVRPISKNRYDHGTFCLHLRHLLMFFWFSEKPSEDVAEPSTVAAGLPVPQQTGDDEAKGIGGGLPDVSSPSVTEFLSDSGMHAEATEEELEQARKILGIVINNGMRFRDFYNLICPALFHFFLRRHSIRAMNWILFSF